MMFLVVLEVPVRVFKADDDELNADDDEVRPLL